MNLSLNSKIINKLNYYKEKIIWILNLKTIDTSHCRTIIGDISGEAWLLWRKSAQPFVTRWRVSECLWMGRDCPKTRGIFPLTRGVCGFQIFPTSRMKTWKTRRKVNFSLIHFNHCQFWDAGSRSARSQITVPRSMPIVLFAT